MRQRLRIRKSNPELNRRMQVAAYMVVDTKIEDLDAYEEYKLKAKPIVEFYGGEYLARGGYTTMLEN
tara:strand:+ start:144 stop:344 length:201 start_codon:yes stop_codon:yes gene_type:complete